MASPPRRSARPWAGLAETASLFPGAQGRYATQTTRGAIASVVKKRLGLTVATERVEITQPDGKTKRTTRYRVVEADTAATEG